MELTFLIFSFKGNSINTTEHGVGASAAIRGAVKEENSHVSQRSYYGINIFDLFV